MITYIIPKKGFTLIETLVAIAIIMIAITGPFATTENSIQAVTIAHDKSIATFLAQEGVEYIHAIRDKVYINECFSASATNCNNWWKDLTTGTKYNVLRCSSAPCSLDMTKSKYTIIASPFTSGALATCAGGVCGKLYLTSSHAYTISSIGNTPTIFSRKIVITNIIPDTIKASVTVRWKEKTVNYSVTATGILTSWE